MEHRPDKAAKRKAKLKARKVHAEQARQQLAERMVNAVMDLCAPVLPEYVDDSKGPDLVGRNILWRIGMIAWNIAVAGRKEIDNDSIQQMRLDAESQEMVRDEVNKLVRQKYAKYPNLRTSIAAVVPVLSVTGPQLKLKLGETYPELPIPDFDEDPKALSPEEILAKRKGLGLSQVKFAAALGVSVKKLSAWEHGTAVPTTKEIVRIISYEEK